MFHAKKVCQIGLLGAGATFPSCVATETRALPNLSEARIAAPSTAPASGIKGRVIAGSSNRVQKDEVVGRIDTLFSITHASGFCLSPRIEVEGSDAENAAMRSRFVLAQDVAIEDTHWSVKPIIVERLSLSRAPSGDLSVDDKPPEIGAEVKAIAGPFTFWTQLTTPMTERVLHQDPLLWTGATFKGDNFWVSIFGRTPLGISERLVGELELGYGPVTLQLEGDFDDANGNGVDRISIGLRILF